MVRLSSYRALGAAGVVLALALPSAAQWAGGDHGPPVYQRHAFEQPPYGYAPGHGQPQYRHGQPQYQHGKPQYQHGRPSQYQHGQPPQYMGPEVSSGWFQRPYPYHLDYYRMRYGGSYAPYFGNLYGPPATYVAPPYYGPYDGYGGYGSYGYGPYGYGFGPYGYPYGYGPTEAQAAPPAESKVESKSDSAADAPAQ